MKAEGGVQVRSSFYSPRAVSLHGPVLTVSGPRSYSITDECGTQEFLNPDTGDELARLHTEGAQRLREARALQPEPVGGGAA